MSDRWRALLTVLVLAGAVAGARALLHALSPEREVLHLPGLDKGHETMVPLPEPPKP